ncbi:MAG: AAA-like domain-containing protein [Woeseia sp.]
MSDSPESKADRLGTMGEYFTTATPLHPVRPGYIRRAADDALYETLVAGHYAQVIAPNRSGKSSLIAATSARLQNNGFKVAVIDLAQISERDGGSDAGRWYYSIAYRLLRQLRLKIDLQDWWQDKSILSNRQRLVEFYSEVVLQRIPEPVVIFIDEIERVADRPLSAHLLASIRAAWNGRIAEPDFARLRFALVGEGDPVNLVPDPSFSPFAISREIRLGDFSRDDLEIFSTELNLLPSDAAIALDRIYYWTSGHPYLTQKLARAVARERISGNIREHVDRIAAHRLAGRAAITSEPHMSHLHRRIVNDRKNSEALLNLYGRLRKGIEVEFDPESRHQRMLLASGLVVPDERGRLKPRNRLYRAVFTARWANENLPLHWRGPAMALALLLALTAIPFTYTQLLPKPYVRVLSATDNDLEAVWRAYVNLGSFPGHAASAERLFRNQLEVRARQTTDLQTMQEIGRYARQLPGEPGVFADNLLADFWDNRASAALRMEQRDKALLAAIEALTVPTPVRRRRAATLLGDDYPLLVGTIPQQDAQHVMFDPENLIATFADGALIRQWSLVDDSLQPRPPWTISALEVAPLVRRVMVDRSGAVQGIGLNVNMAHQRLDDLRLKLIAPSGRAAELVLGKAASASNDWIQVDRGELATLRGEPLAGTWTLSVRDEADNVSGYFMGWELNLNSQVVVEHFDRGLDIPDPVARASDNIWFSADGRSAISRAVRSDSARSWNLTNAQPRRTIAVPASEQVLGLARNAEFLVTAAQNSVHVWRSESGRRHAVLDIGASGADTLLSDDGEHLLVQHRTDANTRFELWSLAEGELVARLEVAGAPLHTAIDASGNHLAMADYDRAVRIWHLHNGQLLAQMALEVEPEKITLSPTGDVLGVVYGNSGIAVWRRDSPTEPIVRERGRGDWGLVFSPSGEQLLAGNGRQGFQVYRSSDGALSGPPLGASPVRGAASLLAISREGDFVVTGDRGGETRIWRAATPTARGGESAELPVSGHQLWRQSGDTLSALGPGGERLAIGDGAGHVHILHVDASAEEIAEAGDEVNYLGHRGPVSDLAFSDDGSFVASAGSSGSVRIWDTETGLPRPWHGAAAAGAVEQMRFSPGGGRLAVLSGHRIWIMNVADGRVLADVELGEVHSGIAFSDNDRIYLGAESGTLRTLATDRTGNWNLRNVWVGSAPLRNLEISSLKKLLVIVDAANQAQLLDLGSGRIGASPMQLPDAVDDIRFSPNETRVLFRTSRWIHRASVSPAGLAWLDAARTPKVISGSRMVFETAARLPGPVDVRTAADPPGNRVMLLTRDAGFAEVAVIDFTHHSGATLFGSREQLLEEWRVKLGRDSRSASSL